MRKSPREQIETARKRERETAYRFVRYLKKDPSIVRLSAEEMVKRFLADNTDIGVNAFAEAFEAGGTGGIFNPNMFGD